MKIIHPLDDDAPRAYSEQTANGYVVNLSIGKATFRLHPWTALCLVGALTGAISAAVYEDPGVDELAEDMKGD